MALESMRAMIKREIETEVTTRFQTIILVMSCLVMSLVRGGQVGLAVVR